MRFHIATSWSLTAHTLGTAVGFQKRWRSLSAQNRRKKGATTSGSGTHFDDARCVGLVVAFASKLTPMNSVGVFRMDPEFPNRTVGYCSCLDSLSSCQFMAVVSPGMRAVGSILLTSQNTPSSRISTMRPLLPSTGGRFSWATLPGLSSWQTRPASNCDRGYSRKSKEPALATQ